LALATDDTQTQTGTPPSSAAGPPASPAPVPTAEAATGAIDEEAFALAYASPAVRKLTREKGVDLGKVKGWGQGLRIIRVVGNRRQSWKSKNCGLDGRLIVMGAIVSPMPQGAVLKKVREHEQLTQYGSNEIH
jgi:pyruvate/2-oxoglutarate dehydrogenase complex dihydrolipoamide acyltransferase (E2) component